MKTTLPWTIAILEFFLILLLLNTVVKKVEEPVKNVQYEANAATPSASIAAEEKPKEESKFKIGDSVGLSINTNLRDKPSGDLIQTLTPSETLELKDGPVSKKGSWWWKATVTNTTQSRSEQFSGLTGYLAEGTWLKKK